MRDAPAVSFALHAPPTPVVTETNSYYAIRGFTQQDLQRQMHRYGPRGEDGRRYDAATLYHMTNTYSWRRERDDCRIQTVNVELSLRTILPEWANPQDAPPGPRDDWPVRLAALRRHEDGHRAIDLKGAQALWDAVSALPPAPDCDAFQRRVKEASESVVRATEAENERYEAATQHGATQGAWPDGDLQP